ncbi:hypothetical protein [Pelagibacterium mangrovi]|uniref:hypothetical protein n=1 Tax=Pelagibacterium mangrovi TaxID=3119828 RepID=UPI002FC80F7E
MTRTIIRLIADHVAAVARLEEAPDSVDPDGTVNPVFSAASDAEERALFDLIDAKPRNTVDLQRKAAYLRPHNMHSPDSFDRAAIEALLLSLMELRLHAA